MQNFLSEWQNWVSKYGSSHVLFIADYAAQRLKKMQADDHQLKELLNSILWTLQVYTEAQSLAQLASTKTIIIGILETIERLCAAIPQDASKQVLGELHTYHPGY